MKMPVGREVYSSPLVRPVPNELLVGDGVAVGGTDEPRPQGGTGGKLLCRCGRRRRHMGTKTIRVSEDVYEQLAACKRPDESFTELLDRLVDRDSQFERGFGALSEVDIEAGLDELDGRLEEAFGRSR
jgi:predicted CopG family antitoxin